MLRRPAVHAALVALPLILAACAASDPQTESAHHGDTDLRPVMLGPLLLGYGLENLPANPTIDQQIAAGGEQIEVLRRDEPTLDSNQELIEYFGGIERRLTESSGQKPPYPIVIHVSQGLEVNAEALPGGHLLIFDRIFEQAGNESEMVAILAHETAHEYHNDFLKFWHDYKADKPVFGKGGALEESQALESDADTTGARMMYAAGWDPSGMVAMLQHLHALGVRNRRGEPLFYSTHPRDRERIRTVEALIAGLPAKDGLIKDTARFEELKGRY
jgi:predicted Zn-dependent protease